MRLRPLPLLALAISALASCAPSGRTDAGASGTAASASSAPPAAPADLRPLREAEQRRSASMVGAPDLSSRDVTIRRAAGRALARIATDDARPLLFRALHDEDPVVVGWAAYGLGFRCMEDREAAVSALAARALTLAPEDDAVAFAPIARAIGRCASTRSQSTLAGWLDGSEERARGAALGLGDLASQEKRLREETLVALLARAEGGVSLPAVPEALFPISRLETVPPSVTERVADVARARLAEAGPFRLFAVRALGRAREAGLASIERVLLAESGGFTMPERVEAARAAGRVGRDGQVLLGAALGKLAERPEALVTDTDLGAVTVAVLTALKEPKGAERALDKVAKLTPPADATPRQKRAASMIRCGAAKVVVPRAADPLLVGCDLEGGYIGKRALLEVLGRGKIAGVAAKTFSALAADPDVRVREAALELLSAHPEIERPAILLEAALSAKEPGVASTAAEQIKKNPNLAADRKAKPKPPADPKKPDAPPKEAKEKPKPDAKSDAAPAPPPDAGVVRGLVALLERAEKDRDLEMLAAAIDAIAAVGAKELAPKIEPHCRSSYPAAREHAAAALGLLGGKKITCDAPARAEEVAPELREDAVPVSILFTTDAGELTITLDPELAPITTLRIADLVRAGYYDGLVMHRVDPSFVVQFGAPFPDGFAGPPGRMPLRCETSPRPFEALDVGVALSGRDTGSSQLFVMRARHPHLDGLYPLVGKASGPWDAVLEGDRIVSARLK